jgi:hypothetical protein
MAAHVPSLDDARLIRLLSAGFGNGAMQRALGVNASTVQRRIHELMERLGAKSRLQAGLVLGQMNANGVPEQAAATQAEIPAPRQP